MASIEHAVKADIDIVIPVLRTGILEERGPSGTGTIYQYVNFAVFFDGRVDCRLYLSIISNVSLRGNAPPPFILYLLRNGIGSRTIEIIRSAASEVNIISGSTILTKPVQDAIAALDSKISVQIVMKGNQLRDDIPPNAERLVIFPRIGNMAGESHFPCVIIIDQQKVIAFSTGDAGTPSALYSESPGFVNLFTGYWSFVKGHASASGQQ